MNNDREDKSGLNPVDIAASEWTVRVARGLTAEEQDQYTEWLAADESHREAIREFQRGWDDLDRLAGLQTTRNSLADPDLLDPERQFFRKKNRRLHWSYVAIASGIAAAIAFAAILVTSQLKTDLPLQPALELMARIELVQLEDGSVVELNRGAAIEVNYSAEERRIYLMRGEANFDVEKDSSRPFIVSTASVDVRAVGTVFSVKHLDDELNVVVTEGAVEVLPQSISAKNNSFPQESLVKVGQMGKVRWLANEPTIEITDLDSDGLAEVNQWRPMLLDFDSTPLREIVYEFNKRNPIQIVLADPEIGDLELSSSFWSDNLEGFVRLMVSSFDMEAEWSGRREIVLRKVKGKSL